MNTNLIIIIGAAIVIAVLSVLYFTRNNRNSCETYVVPATSPSKNYRWCYYTGHPWSIPRISTPDCLNLMTEYQMEWWMYLGYVLGEDGILYTVQPQITRSGVGSQLAQITVGTIAIGNGEKYINEASYGWGVSQLPGQSLFIPPVQDNMFAIEYDSNLTKNSKITVAMKHGVSGMAGSKYNINAKGEKCSMNIDFTDNFGGRMEGVNGYVGPTNMPNPPNSSYEFCFPYNIVTGGSLTMDGYTTKIKEGWLWLDRQMVTYADTHSPKELDVIPKQIKSNPMSFSLSKHHFRKKMKNNSLYTGNWIAGVLPQYNIAFYIACGWDKNPQQGKQWITGAMIKRHALWSIGCIWGPTDANPLGTEIGGEFPKFNINIKFPHLFDKSPHWKSPKTGHVYCSAWRVNFDDLYQGLPAKTLYFDYLQNNCEYSMGGQDPIMEGAAKICIDDKGEKQVGWAWVEQMGLN